MSALSTNNVHSTFLSQKYRPKVRNTATSTQALTPAATIIAHATYCLHVDRNVILYFYIILWTPNTGGILPSSVSVLCFEKFVRSLWTCMFACWTGRHVKHSKGMHIFSTFWKVIPHNEMHILKIEICKKQHNRQMHTYLFRRLTTDQQTTIRSIREALKTKGGGNMVQDDRACLET